MASSTIAAVVQIKCHFLFWMTIWTYFAQADKLESLTSLGNFPHYPFYQHVQMRKEISFDRVPSRDDSITDSESTGSQIGVYASPFQPMTHEVLTHRKHEVYEEKGFSDSAYVHSAIEDSSTRASSTIPRRYDDVNAASRALFHNTISPSAILDFAASSLYDRAAHEKGLYEARTRNTINCSPVTSNRERRKLISGKSGAEISKEYMECVKRRYFGQTPLPREIFDNPLESRRRELKMETMEDFFKTLQNNKNFLHN